MQPRISILMPVFNSGAYLQEAVDSVLNQQSLSGDPLPPFELILVDDHSTDPVTLSVLHRLSTQENVIVIKNQRTKGAAGARNTGIEFAKGEWIGFLDSDDLWFPFALAYRWKAIAANSKINWIGAGFRLLKPSTEAGKGEHFESACHMLAPFQNAALPESVEQLVRPVNRFGEKCMLGIMTVLIRRELILQKGMFDEKLPRAEDYHLWFKCAFDEDLWMVQSEIAFYRIHALSLTHGKNPRHLHEDTMIRQLLRMPDAKLHKVVLKRRLDFVLQDHGYFYRRENRFATATRVALTRMTSRPFAFTVWKELLACALRVG